MVIKMSMKRYRSLFYLPAYNILLLAFLGLAGHLLVGDGRWYFIIPVFYLPLAVALALAPSGLRDIRKARDVLIEVEDSCILVSGVPYAWREILLVQLCRYRDGFMNRRFTMELRLSGGGNVSIDMSAVEPHDERMLVQRMAQKTDVSAVQGELKPSRKAED